MKILILFLYTFFFFLIKIVTIAKTFSISFSILDDGKMTEHSAFYYEKELKTYSIIFSLTEKNMDEAVEFFSQNEFMDFDSTLHIFRWIHYLNEIKTNNIKISANFSLKLLRKRQQTGPLDDFFMKLGNGSIKLFKPCHAAYVLNCAKLGILSYERIIPKIKNYMAKRVENNYETFTAFCWFAPEIEKYDPEFYSKIFDNFQKKCNMPNSPIVFKLFYNKYEEYKANDWKKHREETGSLNLLRQDFVQFLNDDITSTKEYCEKFGYDIKIPPSIFFKSPFLAKVPTLIQVAAYYSVPKIFFYLRNQGAKIETSSFNNQTLMQFAIAGGSMEIIEYLLGIECDHSGMLHFAAMTHQNKIFKWLYETAHADLNEDYGIFGFPIHQAARANNIEILKYCIDHGVDINTRNSENRTPLHICCFYGSLDCLKLLLSYPNIEINAKDVIRVKLYKFIKHLFIMHAIMDFTLEFGNLYHESILI